MEKIETDLKRIKQVETQKQNENFEFRVFLKNYNGKKEVDKIVHKLNEKVSAQIDCTKCGNCCRDAYPVLRVGDVATLAEGLSMRSSEVKKMYLCKDEDGDLVFNKKPCPFLKDNLCTVYSNRPSDCRSFPHLHKSDFVSRALFMVQNYSVCPIIFNVYERLKAEFPEWQSQLKEMEKS
jgi:uncharacterized protein